jgi:dethiobiotin synthetase
VAAFKPVLTGTDEPADPVWPPDDELLAAATGQETSSVAPHRFGPPVSPHLAAELAREAIDPAGLLAAARAAATGADALVVEGVGGLLVPLAPGYLVRDLARELDLSLLVAARAGLGTINHTLLTLESARAAGLRVRGIVITPWPAAAGALEESNRATIAALGDVQVATLPVLPDAGTATLVAAGASLPLDDWLD